MLEGICLLLVSSPSPRICPQVVPTNYSLHSRRVCCSHSGIFQLWMLSYPNNRVFYTASPNHCSPGNLGVSACVSMNGASKLLEGKPQELHRYLVRGSIALLLDHPPRVAAVLALSLSYARGLALALPDLDQEPNNSKPRQNEPKR